MKTVSLTGSILSWIEAHRDQHAILFAAIYELNQECHRFLDGRAVDVTSDTQITTAVLFARLLELFQGLFITVEHGMMSVGRVLGRAHLEAFFYLMAIHRDPTFLGQYLDQLQYHRKALVNRIRKSNDPHLASLREALDEALAQGISNMIQEQNIPRLTHRGCCPQGQSSRGLCDRVCLPERGSAYVCVGFRLTSSMTTKQNQSKSLCMALQIPRQKNC